MRPDEWARAWCHPLICGRPDERRLPPASREFLVRFGLPRVAIFEWRSSFEISFLPLEKPLVTYNSLVRWGQCYSESHDREWGHQLVVGEEEFCQGGAALCIHEQTGIFSRLDCELLGSEAHPAQLFVNSNVELFAVSLLAAQKWSLAVHSGNNLPSAASFGSLTNELEGIDPRAFDDQRYFWPNLIEVVLENPDNEPLELEITTDPKRSRPRF